MAFNNVSDSRMYDEIVEVQDKLRLDDWQLGFLESIEGRAHDDDLSPPQRTQLEKIYEVACRSKF